MLGKGYRHIFVLILLLQSFFLLYSWKTGAYITPDSQEYMTQSENIRNHGSIYSGNLNEPFDPVLQTRRPPLYGIYLTLVTGIYNSPLFILLIQSFLGLVPIFLIIKDISDRHKAKLFYLPIFLVFFPSFFIFNVSIMADALFMFLIFMAFRSIVNGINKNESRQYWYHGIWMFLAVLCKPVLLFIWIPELFFFLFLLYRKRIKINQLVIALFPLMAVVLLSTYNENKTGYFHYSSLKETNLMAYNAKGVLLKNYGVEQTEIMLDSIFLNAPAKEDFKAYSTYLNDAGKTIILNDLSSYLLMQVKGMINFFLDTGRYDIFSFMDPSFKGDTQGLMHRYQEGGISSAWNYLMSFGIGYLLYSFCIFVCNLILLILCIRYLFDKTIALEERLIVFLLLSYICVLTGPIGSARFRLAVYPILLWVGLGNKKLKTRIIDESSSASA